jgi:putative hydroxymethylpyrimidine transporter CytX
MQSILDAINEWIKEILIGAINGNLSTMFGDVNEKVGTIAAEVGKTPQGWNASIFSMIQTLSENVIVPIAGLVITYVLCVELISMVTEKNNLHDIDTFMFFKWFFKAFVAVFIVTHTFDITMAVFDMAQHIVSGAAGVIGGRVRKSAMETVKMSFGHKGSILFAVLNVLQLVGWTAIMIYDGALAADGVMHTGRWIWCLVIGVLIILWIVIGITNLGKINTVAMAALFLLSLILSKVIFAGGGAGAPSDDSMTFGAAVELAVAMPLSWLPLISDYTREAKEPVKATAISAVVYGIVSCWMYVIGMGAAIITGEYDIAQIMLKAGLGIAGLLIIVFSTVTTTFLDAYSAGISSETVVSKWNGKHVAIVVTVIGTIAAIVYPMDNITDFLYLIGSVFAPMIAIQIADFFLLKRDKSSLAVHIPNLIIWVIGFVVYRNLMNIDMPLGNTLPDMVITIVICLIVGKFVS